MKELTGFASIDRPWLKYYPEEVTYTKVPEMSIFQLLKESNQSRLNNPAMRYYDFVISYKKYLKNIENSAKSLQELGTKKNEIVLLSLPNIPECRTLIYALNILGSIAYPTSPMMPSNILENIINENEVQTIFMFEGFYQKYAKILEKNHYLKNIVVLDGTESIPTLFVEMKKWKDKLSNKNQQSIPISNPKNIFWKEFASFKQYHPNTLIPFYEPNHTAAIIGTSGTTGTPKGVCLTNENLNAMAIQHLIGDMNFQPKDRLLDILIQSIGYGISVAHYSGVCGLESILVPELVTNILPYLRKYKPSHFTGGPVHYENLVKQCEKESCKPPIAKNMVSGGATLEKIIEKKLNQVDEAYVEVDNDGKVFVRQGFGCTENGGAATYAKKGAYKFGGLGIPLALENMGIFKPGTDEELPYGIEGEICISGPTVMKEYFHNPSETERVLKKHKDGTIWLHTYDLGKVDEDGQFYITDRMKDIFMRKGFNVHPSKIGEFLLTLPNVSSCKVVGVSHPEEQTVPVAFIELKDVSNLNQEKEFIMNKCYENLEEPSIPYEIIFVDKMPRNLGGKIDSNYLLEICNIDYQSKKAKTYSLVKVNR